jgi:tripartite-type tricarboxylate transporter receptor subunit TctC
VIVDSHPGAGGILAMDLVAKAKPDGYTIAIVSSAQLVLNVYLFANLPYDSAHDFAPIVRLVSGQAVIAAHPRFPANSVPDLIAVARANPGTIHYAVPQLGAPPHVFALMLAHEAQIDLVAIPFSLGTGGSGECDQR